MSDMLDQTSFIEDQVRDSAPGLPHASQAMPVVNDEEDETTPKKAVRKPSPLMLVGIVAIILIVILVAIVAAMPKKQGALSVIPTGVEPSSAPLVPSAVQKSIDDVRNDVKQADPLSNDLPFPPVNFKLHLTAQ